MIGVVGVGYVSWSQALAQLPMEIMTMVIRLTFPAFARLQHDKEALAKGVTKSLFLTALLVYPAIFGIGAILPFFVGGVINPKWEPAVPSYYLFAVNTYWAVISTTFTNVLNAAGYIKTTLKLMIMWVVLTWILTPILTFYYGMIGVGLSSFVISFSSIITIILVRRIIDVKVMDAIFLPTQASIFMAIIVFLISRQFMDGWLSLGIIVGIGAICYGGFIYLFGRKQIMEDIRALRND
jgi:teichuronic acid exporter